MEEKNELNDIILNKGGSGSNSKKLLLAIATLTLVLIVVLVIMNSLKSETNEQPPQVAIPPEPTAPTEVIDDPLFEPVEVIEEGSNTTAQTEDLGQIAQKIKQESFENTPVQENVIEPAPVQPAAAAAPVRQSAPAVQPKPAAPVAAPKAEPKPAPKPAAAPVATPTIKSVKPAEPKKSVETKKSTEVKKTAATAAPKPATPSATAEKEPAPATKSAEPAPKAADTGTYFIQVGSFTKEPNKVLFDRLNASGLKYTTVPSGAATKVLVGPFQGEKAARDVLGTVRKNIESGAYIVKG